MINILGRFINTYQNLSIIGISNNIFYIILPWERWEHHKPVDGCSSGRTAGQRGTHIWGPSALSPTRLPPGHTIDELKPGFREKEKYKHKQYRISTYKKKFSRHFVTISNKIVKKMSSGAESSSGEKILGAWLQLSNSCNFFIYLVF